MLMRGIKGGAATLIFSLTAFVPLSVQAQVAEGEAKAQTSTVTWIGIANLTPREALHQLNFHTSFMGLAAAIGITCFGFKRKEPKITRLGLLSIGLSIILIAAEI